jgi:DNA helicase-2/ATP-dependent DNA helicase PcrA
MSLEDILKGLNAEQEKAARHTNGPLLVLAGAGSGKTRVLTSRIACLLSGGVRPWQILAITFTNKAAKEMKERVERLVGRAAKDIWIYTFHSFCARFLRTEIAGLKGYDHNFVIYDAADSLNVLKSCLKELNLDDKRFKPGGVLEAISGAKAMLRSAAEFGRGAGGFYEGKIAALYEMYEGKRKGCNAVDFDDLLLLTVRLLGKDAEVRERWQSKFLYVLVDEYQDTNRPQYLITNMLCEKTRNLFVVGDIDQSIYAWRGADIRNILDFEKDYPEARTVKLECNYRSTRNILDAANAVIANNAQRKPKSLWTLNEAGAALVYYQAADERDEARFVVAKMQKLRQGGDKYGSMAVLYRTNTQSRVFEEALVKYGVPYVIVGGLKFYERREIKDMVAYLRVIFNPGDEVGLLRIINVPGRGIGAATVAKLRAFAQKGGLLLYDALPQAEAAGLLPRLADKARKLRDLLDGWRAGMDAWPLPDLLERIMEDSGYIAELKAENSVQAEGRLDNLRELITVARGFVREENNSLDDFLQHIALVSDVDEAKTNDDAVTLMTLHSAKGLEYPVVFMPGMEEGIFPHERSLRSENAVEEERRLCYVGITRARRLLFVSGTDARSIYGRTVSYQPSRFLREIPKPLMEVFKKENKFPGGAPGTRAGFFIDPPPLYQPPKPSAAGIAFFAGDKVSHPHFGLGTVVSAIDRDGFQEVAAAFPGQGIKRLSTKYAPLTKLPADAGRQP